MMVKLGYPSAQVYESTQEDAILCSRMKVCLYAIVTPILYSCGGVIGE